MVFIFYKKQWPNLNVIVTFITQLLELIVYDNILMYESGRFS